MSRIASQETKGDAVNVLLSESKGIQLLPAFLGIADEAQKNSSGDKEKRIRVKEPVFKPEGKKPIIYFVFLISLNFPRS